MANYNYDQAGSGSYTTLATALAAVAASDEIIFAKSTSAEVLGGTTTYTASATYALAGKAQRLFSVDDFTTPDLTTGASITWTGAYSAIFVGNWHLYGMTIGITGGTSTTATGARLGDAAQPSIIIADYCRFLCLTTGASATPSPLILGPTASSSNDGYVNKINNCTVEFGHASQSITINESISELNNLILGGSITPTSLFKAGGSGVVTAKCTVKNSDLSNKSWTNFYSIVASTQVDIYLENCKMPASFNWYTGTPQPGVNIIAVNCTSGDNGISLYRLVGSAGTVQTDSSIYASSNPETDGGVPVSYLMTPLSTCGRSQPLSQEFLIPVATDTAVTPYVEVLLQTSGATALKTTELYIEVEALATDGSSLGIEYTTHPGLMNAGGTDCASGTINYTGDGYATEVTHKLSVDSFTTRQNGFIKITVNLAKSTQAIYVGQYGI